jgi:hypothetical protein
MGPQVLTNFCWRLKRDTQTAADVMGVQGQFEATAWQEVWWSGDLNLGSTPDDGTGVGLGHAHHSQENASGSHQPTHELLWGGIRAQGERTEFRIGVEVPRREEERGSQHRVDGMVSRSGAAPFQRSRLGGPIPVRRRQPGSTDDVGQCPEVVAIEAVGISSIAAHRQPGRYPATAE